MLNSKNTLLALRSVLLQLRVPELKYAVGESAQAASQDKIAEFIQSGLEQPRALDSESVVKSLEAAFGLAPLAGNLNNCAFITDRLFDVWKRKNQLADELNAALACWRFPVFVMLYRSKVDLQLRPLLAVIERIASSQLGWSASARHAKSMLLEHVEMLTITIRQRLLNNEELSDLHQLNDSFLAQQEDKRKKVVERLCASESMNAKNRYARWQAVASLNQRFADTQLTDATLCFLTRYWFPALVRVMSQGSHEQIAEFKRHQDQLYAVFCKKEKWALKYGDELIEVLASALKALQLPETVPDELWQSLEKDIIAVLQNQSLEEYPFTPLVFADEDVLQFVDSYAVRHAPAQGDWYLMQDAKGLRRVCAELVDVAVQQVLLVDALGIKVLLCALPEFDDLVGQGVLKPIPAGSPVEQVFESTVSGLYKIADAQSKARVKAAEKAKLEAERLLEEQHQAQLEAQARAEEIAIRTRDLQDKQAEKQRLARVKVVTDSLAQFNVGGWIDFMVDGQPQRYKLAVKIAASGKHIFVDRLGIKRMEFSEVQLVERILGGEITILSGGAEFENSLERVVSRLRMQK